MFAPEIKICLFVELHAGFQREVVKGITTLQVVVDEMAKEQNQQRLILQAILAKLNKSDTNTVIRSV